MFKNTKGDFFSTHNPFLFWRNPLGTGYPSVHLGTVAPPNLMGMENAGVIYKLLGIWDILINPSPLGLGLSPSYLLYREDVNSSINSVNTASFVFFTYYSKLKRFFSNRCNYRIYIFGDDPL